MLLTSQTILSKELLRDLLLNVCVAYQSSYDHLFAFYELPLLEAQRVGLIPEEDLVRVGVP